MDVFSLREAIVAEYGRFTRSFGRIAAPDIQAFLDQEYDQGRFWPAPLIQLNPNFVPGRSIDELVDEGLLHPECARIFRAGKQNGATIFGCIAIRKKHSASRRRGAATCSRRAPDRARA